MVRKEILQYYRALYIQIQYVTNYRSGKIFIENNAALGVKFFLFLGHEHVVMSVPFV